MASAISRKMQEILPAVRFVAIYFLAGSQWQLVVKVACFGELLFFGAADLRSVSSWFSWKIHEPYLIPVRVSTCKIGLRLHFHARLPSNLPTPGQHHKAEEWQGCKHNLYINSYIRPPWYDAWEPLFSAPIHSNNVLRPFHRLYAINRNYLNYPKALHLHITFISSDNICLFIREMPAAGKGGK